MRHLPTIRTVLALALMAGAPCMAAEAALPLTACKLPDLAGAARCGVLELPENPDRPDGRKLPIHVAVLPATSGRARPDPIAVLMGGPGEEAIGAAGFYAAQFAALRKDRDLLFVDQRGAGQSAPLHCDLYSPEHPATSLQDLFPPAAVAACEARLAQTADLTRYGFSYFAADLEQVRLALGYGKLNLFAGSYGTRAAQVYLRAYPDSVRTAYQGSVVPIDIETPLAFAPTAQAALDRLFADCAADAACRRAYPKLSEEFRQLLDRLDAGQARVALPGHAEPVALGRGRVAEWIRAKLYRPKSSADLPWLLHRAFAGDWQPIADDILSDAEEADHALSFGLLFAITCNEDIPFVAEAEVAPQSAGTALGDYRLRQQQAACAYWPRSALPENYRKPVVSAVPTLFVTGNLDGGTPLWFTQRVAQGFADHATLIARGQGHTEWSRCVARRYARLLQSGTARGLDAMSCPAVPRPPFKL